MWFTASVSLRWAANSKDSGFWIWDWIWFWWYWPGWRKSSWNSTETRLLNAVKNFHVKPWRFKGIKKEPDCWRGSEHITKGNSYKVGSLYSYKLFVSQLQQQGERSVHADCRHCQQRHCARARDRLKKRSCHCYVLQCSFTTFANKVTCRGSTIRPTLTSVIEEFGWRMKWRLVLKSN